MAITRVQQTQISGSLSHDDMLEAGSGLGAKANLKGDLDSLRSQINRIIGGSNWYSALSGSTGLAEIYAAVHMSGVNADFQGTLDVTGAAVLDGTLNVGGASQFAAVNASGAVALASTLQAGASTLSSLTVSGASSLAAVGASGAASFASTVDVIGASTFANASNSFNALSVSGSSGLTVAGSSSLAAVTASGMGTFNGGINVESGRLAISDGGAGVTMNGTLGVTGASSLSSATLSSTLGVMGGATFSSTVGVTGASTFANISNQFNALSVTGSAGLAVIGPASFSSTVGVTGASTFANVSNQFNALSVTGSAGLAVIGPASFSSTVGVTGAISAASPSNVMNGLSVTGSNGLSVSSNLSVLGNATVQGDLYVQGTTTYIQTDNMIVKDAFIYLATGSAGTTDSGLVFMKGAGAGFDLIFGQDNGDGEFIFAKQAHNASLDSPSDLHASALVPAWMSVTKIGANEGTLGGSLSMSGSNFLVKAESSAQLQLQSAGNAAISFASASQVPDASFAASTVVGMLNELRQDLDGASAGGNLSKVSYAGNSGAISSGVLTFIAQSLASADHKLVDVFLNGVMLSPTFDLTAITTSSVTLSSAISSSLVADDVIVVIARG